MLLAPLIALSFFITLSHFDGSLFKFVEAVLKEGILPILTAHGPQFSLEGTFAYVCWIALQAMLFQYLSDERSLGLYFLTFALRRPQLVWSARPRFCTPELGGIGCSDELSWIPALSICLCKGIYDAYSCR